MAGLGHKRIRLPANHYATEDSLWLVTSGTRHRQPAMSQPDFAREVMNIIDTRCRLRDAVPWVYCVMPDHFHLLVQVGSIDLVTIVREIKSLSAHAWWRYGGRGKLWQPSFHDRGIRQTERIDEIIRYIFNNPVRAGMVDDPSDYPFTGGEAFRDQEQM